MIPLLAVLLVLIGIEAQHNQVVLGLLWGFLFSILGLAAVVAYNQLPPPTEESEP